MASPPATSTSPAAESAAAPSPAAAPRPATSEASPRGAPAAPSTGEEAIAPAAAELAAPNVVEELRSRSRLLLLGGLGLMGLAFIFSWWSLTKYRVAQERGVNINVPATQQELLKNLGDKRADYEREAAEYRSAWEINTRQYNAFYQSYAGSSYQTDLQNQIDRSLVQGTIYFRGWSTWTGWLGFLAILTYVVLTFGPRFAPEQMEPWAWTAPWAVAVLGGLYFLLALAFYFNVPDENGPGYSQGVGFGNYIAILAGLAAAIGGTFEGLASAKRRLEEIEQSPDEEAEEAETPAPESKPPLPGKGPGTGSAAAGGSGAGAPAAKGAPAKLFGAKKPPAAPEEKPPEKNRLMDW
jgi:hypothetical protein